MAKFRNGNLVLTSSQEIKQGDKTIIDDTGAADVNSLKISDSQVITDISSDSTSSDVTQLLTASAVQTLVAGGGGVAGTSGTSGTSGVAGTSGIAGTSGSSGTSGTSSVTAAGIDNSIARYDGTTTIQDSEVFIDDYGNVSGINDATCDGYILISESPVSQDHAVNKAYVDAIDVGTEFFVGSGVPEVWLGVAEDKYLDEDTDILYKKDNITYGAAITTLDDNCDSTTSPGTSNQALPSSPSPRDMWSVYNDSNYPSAWWYDFGETSYIVKKIQFKQGWGGYYYPSFYIYGSNNFVDWDTIASVELPVDSLLHDIIINSNTSYRYIKFERKIDPAGGSFGIGEVIFFELATVDWRIVSYIGDGIPTGADNAIVTYDGTAAMQASLVSIDDSGNVTGINDLAVGGNLFVVNSGEVTVSGQAVATREDNPIDKRVPWWNDPQTRFDTTGDSFIIIDQTADSVVVGDDSLLVMTVTDQGLALEVGDRVNEISDDSTTNTATALLTAAAIHTLKDEDVTSALNITDNSIVRGDGGVKGVQDSLVTIDDSGNILMPTTNIGSTTPGTFPNVVYADYGYYLLQNTGFVYGRLYNTSNDIYCGAESGAGDLNLYSISATIKFLTAGQIRWAITNTGDFYPLNTTLDIGLTNFPIGNLYIADDKNAYFGASQDAYIGYNSSDYFTIENTGSAGFYINQKNASGSMYLGTGAGPTTAIEIDNSQNVTMSADLFVDGTTFVVSSGEVTVDGQLEIITGGNQAILVKEPAAESDYNVLMTNAGNTGGVLKLDLDGHTVNESYNAIDLSNVSSTPYTAYGYVNALWALTNIAGATTEGEAIDIYGGEFATWTRGTGYYSSIYGGGSYADVRTDAQVAYITAHSMLARQQAACTKPSDALISAEHLAYVYGSGLIAEAKAAHNFIDADASANVTDLYGTWTQVNVGAGATIGDIYFDRMQFTGTGGATNTIWGLYVEGAEKNYMEGDLTLDGKANVNSLQLENGVTVNEISNDSTSSGEFVLLTAAAIHELIDNLP